MAHTAAHDHPTDHDPVDLVQMSDAEMRRHETTYESFLKLGKWTIISIVVLLILMAIFLV